MRKILPLRHESSEDIGSTAGSAAQIPEALARFAEERRGNSVRFFRAPGRVNLIGEHTDYNDGFVLPAAIRFSAWAAAAKREDRKVVVHSANFGDTREFDADRLPASRSGHWSDYIAGVIGALAEDGMAPPGAELTISGDVPIGSGLSSSAALETVTALALVSLAGMPIDRTRIALACQKAE